jgi:hypothetical protein
MVARRKCCDNTVSTVHDRAYLSDNEHAESVTVVPTVSNDSCSDSLSKNSHMRNDDSGDTLQARMKRACSIKIMMPAENEKNSKTRRDGRC